MGICIGSMYTMRRIERTWVERGRTEGWNDKQLLITSFFPSWVGESSECWDLFRKEGGGEFGRVNNFKNNQRYVYMGVFLFSFCWVQCKGHHVSELKKSFWKGIKVYRYMHFLFDSWWNAISYTSICVCVCVPTERKDDPFQWEDMRLNQGKGKMVLSLHLTPTVVLWILTSCGLMRGPSMRTFHNEFWVNSWRFTAGSIEVFQGLSQVVFAPRGVSVSIDDGPGWFSSCECRELASMFSWCLTCGRCW